MKVRKAIFVAAGSLCVGLGVLGMFLPLMPTTVFLLLAAYFYSKSSDRFYDWLIANRWCGEYIRNYRSGRGITARQKASTVLTLWPSVGLSIWLIDARVIPTAILAAIATGVTVYILRMRTYRPEEEIEKQLDELAASASETQ